MRAARRPPGAYVHGLDGPCVVIPGWVADWLLRQTNLDRRRVELRGTDRAVDDVLVAVRECALRWRDAGSAAGAVDGTSLDGDAEPTSGLAMSGQLSTGQVAAALGMTARAVRKAITEGRLPAQNADGRWLIDQNAVDEFRRHRAT